MAPPPGPQLAAFASGKRAQVNDAGTAVTKRHKKVRRYCPDNQEDGMAVA